ncbi:hypothetical protein FOA52_002550 [Chlamydomonas sp. UWO 241]|nr:hypothetical protein FOA52_002550 [Chlamydomonas sp. UWO 241]
MEERSSSSPLRAFNVQAPPQPAAGAVQGQAQQQHAASEAAARASLSSTSSDSSSSSSSSGIGDLESGAGGAVPPGRESSPEQRGSMRDAAEEPANNSPLVLTPSRLRIDSRSLVVHTTATWLTNAVWVLLILLKLTGDIGDASWWAVWVPALLNHLIDIPLQVMLIVYAPAMIGRQIGPPPPASASVGLHAQYLHLALSRTRSHVIDALTAAMDSIALLIVKCLFCNALEKGVLNDTSMRLIFTPFWAAWVVCTILDCLKERSERVLGSTRDVLYLTLLFIALQKPTMRLLSSSSTSITLIRTSWIESAPA